MADQNHVKILRQNGVSYWYSWRVDWPRIIPDLSRTDWSRANLSGINLDDANLAEVNFYCANLSRAHLDRANLEGAKIHEAIFNRSTLHRTNLKTSYLRDTIFYDVDLSTVIGLEDCVHEGPSCVDNLTLSKSKGVPVKFWHGCGLLDWQIEAAKLGQPGLSQDDVVSISYEVARLRGEQPIQLFSPFISYSSEDDEFAKHLYDGLQGNGVRCWYAPEDMKIGDRIRNRIDEVIHIHDKLLLVLSEHSVASHWVEQEVETALEKERETGETVLFPIKVDDAVDGMKAGWPALVRKTRHIGDFTNWRNATAFKFAFDRVLRDLRAMP